MNSPHVVTLIYSVEHGIGVTYDNAVPLKFNTPEFRLEIKENSAQFDMVNYYKSEEEARAIVDPFIRRWEFEVGLSRGPDQFRLEFERAEMSDDANSITLGRLRVTSHGSIVLSNPSYPDPPSESLINPNDPDVNSMFNRYMSYRSNREYLPSMAYFCLTMLEYKFEQKQRASAAKKFAISRNVLDKVGLLSAKGGPTGRKAASDELSEEETIWLNHCIRRVIYRAAEVAAIGHSHPLHKITMDDLPSLK